MHAYNLIELPTYSKCTSCNARKRYAISMFSLRKILLLKRTYQVTLSFFNNK